MSRRTIANAERIRVNGTTDKGATFSYCVHVRTKTGGKKRAPFELVAYHKGRRIVLSALRSARIRRARREAVNIISHYRGETVFMERQPQV